MQVKMTIDQVMRETPVGDPGLQAPREAASTSRRPDASLQTSPVRRPCNDSAISSSTVAVENWRDAHRQRRDAGRRADRVHAVLEPDPFAV
jgi:hypothetical protein